MPLGPHSLALLVRKLAGHGSLQPADREAILTLPHVRRQFEPGAYLLREGDMPDQCGVLLSGFVFRHKLSGDGQRQILSLHVPGDAIDLQSLYLAIADHNIQALTRVEIAVVPQAAMQALIAGRPAVARAAMAAMMAEASISREWLLNVGRRDARTRIAHLLCEFAIRIDAQGLSGPDGYDLPMTQEQIGDAVGLTAIHVNRTMKGLEADGLLQRRKRHITFPDWERLRAVGDFTGRYLHLRGAGGG